MKASEHLRRKVFPTEWKSNRQIFLEKITVILPYSLFNLNIYVYILYIYIYVYIYS